MKLKMSGEMKQIHRHIHSVIARQAKELYTEWSTILVNDRLGIEGTRPPSSILLNNNFELKELILL
jgi:hypothetical protein